MSDPAAAAAAQLASASAVSDHVAARVDYRMRGLGSVALALLLGGYIFSFLELFASGAGLSGKTGALLLLMWPTILLLRGVMGRDGVTPRASIPLQLFLLVVSLAPFTVVSVLLSLEPVVPQVGVPQWALILSAAAPTVTFAARGLVLARRASPSDGYHARERIALPRSARILTLVLAVVFATAAAAPPGPISASVLLVLTIGLLVLAIGADSRWGPAATGGVWGPLHWCSYVVALIGIDLVLLLGGGWPALVRVAVAVVVVVPLLVSAILPGRHGRE